MIQYCLVYLCTWKVEILKKIACFYESPAMLRFCSTISVLFEFFAKWLLGNMMAFFYYYFMRINWLFLFSLVLVFFTIKKEKATSLFFKNN